MWGIREETRERERETEREREMEKPKRHGGQNEKALTFLRSDTLISNKE